MMLPSGLNKIAVAFTTAIKDGIYLGTPAVMSKKCTDVGTIHGNDKDRGRRCQSCHDLRQKRGSSNPGSTLNNTDCDNAKSLIKVKDELLTESGNQLKEEAQSQVEDYEYIADLPVGIKLNVNYEVEAPGVFLVIPHS
eukprot:scaffold7176_cov75-Attheya_sp.AAC.2